MKIREIPWFERPGDRLKDNRVFFIQRIKVWYNTFNQKQPILVNYTLPSFLVRGSYWFFGG
jgi:hypothetical protein